MTSWNDLRLWLRQQIDAIDAALLRFQRALFGHAEEHLHTRFPATPICSGPSRYPWPTICSRMSRWLA